MIVVTGGAGFIGSCAVAALNGRGIRDIAIADHLGKGEKWRNLANLEFSEYVDKADLFSFLENRRPDAVLHFGACSATTELDADYLMENNYRYTTRLAAYCLERGARFVYASSAATYGGGEQGYSDDEECLERLRPLNPYGYSKHLFDLKARRQGWLTRSAGLKFFNVYGPNEYHKGEMCSVVLRAWRQIRAEGEVRLFKSYRGEYADGGQLRDFIYVKDAVRQALFLLDHPEVNGLFNSGTGRARSFDDLAKAVFLALGLPPRLRYVDMPPGLAERYQYFTEAEMGKSAGAGYPVEPTALEDGVRDYVLNYLERGEARVEPWKGDRA